MLQDIIKRFPIGSTIVFAPNDKYRVEGYIVTNDFAYPAYQTWDGWVEIDIDIDEEYTVDYGTQF